MTARSEEPVTLWVRAAYEGPQTIDDEVAALTYCRVVSVEIAGIADTGIFRVLLEGPCTGDLTGIPVKLYAARVFNEFGCDVWAAEPTACTCDGARCDICHHGDGTSTGRGGIVEPSLDDDFFYPAGGSGGP